MLKDLVPGIRTSRNTTNIVGRTMRGKPIYEYATFVKTSIGEFREEEWLKIVIEAIKNEGKEDLFSRIKEHCRKNCAWIKKESELELYSARCLLSEAYLHWDDFK